MDMWVVIATSSYAEIYSINNSGMEIKKVHFLDFPDGRKKSGEIDSDKPGRNYAKGSSTRHAYSPHDSDHQHQQKVLASKIAEVLRKDHAENAFENLILIAPPEFLGELRPALTKAVRECVRKELTKTISSDLAPKDRMEMLIKMLDLRHPTTARTTW